MANYPYDGTPSGNTAYNPTPDDGTFRFLARTYASRHVMVSGGADAPGGGGCRPWARRCNMHCKQVIAGAGACAASCTTLTPANDRHTQPAPCPLQMANSTEFPGGITNGAAWYPIYGGMQVGASVPVVPGLQVCQHYSTSSTMRLVWCLPNPNSAHDCGCAPALPPCRTGPTCQPAPSRSRWSCGTSRVRCPPACLLLPVACI